jgi:hypothetical protein
VEERIQRPRVLLENTSERPWTHGDVPAWVNSNFMEVILFLDPRGCRCTGTNRGSQSRTGRAGHQAHGAGNLLHRHRTCLIADSHGRRTGQAGHPFPLWISRSSAQAPRHLHTENRLHLEAHDKINITPIPARKLSPSAHCAPTGEIARPQDCVRTGAGHSSSQSLCASTRTAL